MNKSPNRRDFLKLAGAVSVNAASLPFIRLAQASRIGASEKKNVLIVVFDAFSARHISLYGYGRETTPNISRLAERAIVYHNHYAGGNFTTPGTASLLTGTLPWTHRANGFYSPVVDSFLTQNIFHAFDDYFRIAYSHNPLAARLFDQFSADLNNYIPVGQFLLTNDGIVDKLFANDPDIASVGWERAIKQEQGTSYSLFFSDLYKNYQKNRLVNLKSQFPLGLPSIKGDNYFTLEDVMSWLRSQVGGFPNPYFGYFHFLPPHFPYAPRLDFFNHFQKDNLPFIEKPDDLFNKNISSAFLRSRRQMYDEYILYLDAEFGKLFDHLETNGLLDDTWVILTSDHGELFERGIMGHVTPVLYESVIRIPLLIFEPGRNARTDIYSKTSATDLLPTLLHLTGGGAASWSEGTVLPPFTANDTNQDRNIYVVYGKNKPDGPLEKVTLASIKGDLKLIYFSGYKELNDKERVELYNLVEDPEELNNLYSQSGAGAIMLDELKSKLKEKDAPYS